MVNFILGKGSLTNLVGVHPKLRAVINNAICISKVDFKVIEGVRAPERQKELYAQGRTKPGNIVTWTLNSNHFVNKLTGYGHAVDLLPAPYDWKETANFDAVANAVFESADKLGVKVRWGADWDMDGNYRERGESDSPHFELYLD